jgi:hypothetical protein
MTPEPLNTSDITDGLLDSFNSSRKNEMAEVLKELFDEKKIFMIGDLSKEEIQLATRIYIIAKMKGIDMWLEGLVFYSKFLLSRDRRSRRELLDAIKGYNNQQGGGFLGMNRPNTWR